MVMETKMKRKNLAALVAVLLVSVAVSFGVNGAPDRSVESLDGAGRQRRPNS
jgi:hypothetical protein